MTEQEMQDQATYHVGLFMGRLSGRATPAEIAHALFLLAQRAGDCRAQWLEVDERLTDEAP